jgi:hypothetical protein
MTMREVSFTGGARVGWVNATWPFARLSADGRTLTLASLVGTYEFKPQQVVSLAAYGVLPVFGQGVRIHHNRGDYPAKLVFWCFGSPDSVLADIRGTGFIAKGEDIPRAPGWPVRWLVLLAAFVAWNVLFYADAHLPPPRPQHAPGGLALLAMALLFAATLALRLSAGFQRFVLNPGHSLGEIQGALNLLTILSGFLSIMLGFEVVSGWLA